MGSPVKNMHKLFFLTARKKNLLFNASLAKREESRPISRVLSWTVIHLGYTSPYTSSNLPGNRAGHALFPYLVLLQAGFTLPPVLPPARCALTAPFHPYRHLTVLRRYIFCGTFRRLSPPRRYLAPCPSEPGLSSVPLRMDTATAWPTLLIYYSA